MNRKGMASAATLAVACAFALQRGVLASDHLDGPRTTAMPQADIADVFAFTSPESPGHVVLAMTAWPYAGAADGGGSAAFARDVFYVFRVRRILARSPLTLDAPVLDVTCDFDGASPQHVTCATPNGLVATSALGDATGGGDTSSPMRVFAGLRADPAYFDRQGAIATVASHHAEFTGQNAFQGANVLAIVVEMDSLIAFGTDDAAAGPDGGVRLPMLAVAGETLRKGN